MSLRIPELTPERGRMAALIESGRVADLILAIMVLEAAVLCALAMRRPAREPVAGLLLNLGAGASGGRLAGRSVARACRRPDRTAEAQRLSVAPPGDSEQSGSE